MPSLFDERASNSCAQSWMAGVRRFVTSKELVTWCCRLGHRCDLELNSGSSRRFSIALASTSSTCNWKSVTLTNSKLLRFGVFDRRPRLGVARQGFWEGKKIHRDLLVTREISTFFFQFGTWKMWNLIQWLGADARDHLLEDSNTCFLRFDFLLGGIVCNSASRGTTMCNCMPLWATPNWYAFCKKLNCLQFTMCNSQLTHSYWAHSKFTEHAVNCVWFTVCFRKITIMPVIANELVEIVPIFLIINKWHY